MPKSSKRFTISTDAVNAQGFRMLTSGVLLDEFTNNPLLLFNHIRPEGGDANQLLPIGYWDDVEMKDGKITGVPVFDDNDEFAMKIYNKVEHGTLRMCSAGAEPIETSGSQLLVLPGQTHETVTRWRLKEGSICDIGANPEALAVQLYDGNKPIQLSTKYIPKITIKMADDKKTEELSDDEKKLKKLGGDKPREDLSDDEKDEQLKKLQAEVKKLKKLLADQEDEKKLNNAKTLVTLAKTEGRITVAQVPHFEKLAQLDYDGTKAVLEAMPVYESIERTLKTTGAVDKTRLETLSKKSFEELFKSEKDTSFLKLHAPDVYMDKYREKFGKEPPKKA